VGALGWVALFVGIAVVGAVVLVRLLLRLWRTAQALLGEVDVLAGQAGQLADLLAQVELPEVVAASGPRRSGSDEGWPGTVETYDDGGATAPGKKEP
jgi:hypothetical protein